MLMVKSASSSKFVKFHHNSGVSDLIFSCEKPRVSNYGKRVVVVQVLCMPDYIVVEYVMAD